MICTINTQLRLALPNYYSENLTKNTHELSHSCSFSKENILMLLNDVGFDFVKQTGDELNVGYIVRKAQPHNQEMLQEKLTWMKTFMPHRGLAHILEKYGLAQIPKVVEQDIDVSIDWHFVAQGKPPETHLALDYTFYKEYSPVLNAVAAFCLAFKPANSIIRLTLWVCRTFNTSSIEAGEISRPSR